MHSTVSLKDNRMFRRMYNCKNFAVSPFFVVYAKKNKLSCNRLGLTVSVKLGCAVLRNRIKRRIKEVYRLNEGKIAGTYDIVIVARARAKDAPFDVMERVFSKCISQVGISSVMQKSNSADA